MQDELMRLLEKIEAAPLGNRLTVRELINEGNPSNESIVERKELLKDAFEKGYIENTDNYAGIVDSTTLRLKITGLEFLNQIRIKEAIEKFNASSDKYSIRIIYLTIVIVILTLVLLVKEFIR